MMASRLHPRGAFFAALLVTALVLCANAEMVTYDLIYVDTSGGGGSLTGVWSFDTNEISYTSVSEAPYYLDISSVSSMTLTLELNSGTADDGVYESTSYSSSQYAIAPKGVSVDFSQDLVPQVDNLNFKNLGPLSNSLSYFAIRANGNTPDYDLTNALPRTEPGSSVVGDPHFFVSDTHIYDWKQIGTYNYLEFETHAIQLSVDDYAGCDGQMTGEFVRAIGIADSPTTVVASCEGIYRNDNTTLVATTAIHLETECVSIDVVLTNGYLNLYNVVSTCPVIGGVHKAISDHAATNSGGWWEVVDGEYTHKFHEVPKVVPLEKRPMKIVIDI